MRPLIAILFKAGALSAALSLPAAGCTVKEDRTPCPCYLQVGFSDRGSIPPGAEVLLLGWGEEELFRAGIDVADHDPYWVKAVRKGTFCLSACRGGGAVTGSGHCVTITPGHQCDSLYAYHAGVDATGDMAHAQVTFRKQFCTVHLDIMRTPSEMSRFRFLVEGNSCGFDLLTFDPVPGTYRFTPEPETGGRLVDFRIPRQADEDLSLTLWCVNADGALDRIGTFPLGSYIARTGYDWKAEDLQDVYIIIDLVLGQMLVSVEGWENGVLFPFIEQ